MVKKAVIIVAVVTVVIIVAAAAFVMLGGNDKEGSNDVTFLIQDDKGVYFWIEGSGETALDALEDAFSDYPNDTLVIGPYGIDSIFGQSTAQDDEGNWVWWIQLTWKDNKWSTNTQGLEQIKSKDVSYVLMLFGAGNMEDPEATAVPEGTPVPNDKAVWDGNINGTVFLIQSESGLYFEINGTGGSNLLETFKNACSKYKIELETGHSTYDENDYLLGIFGIYSSQDDEGDWLWWVEYEYTSDGWVSSSTGMGELTSSDNLRYALMYGTNDMM